MSRGFRALSLFAASLGLVQAQDENLADSLVFDIVVRDFQPTHADFETFEVGNPNSTCTRDPNQAAITADPKFKALTGLKATKDLVQKKLDKDGKPVAATAGNCATTKLAEWFRDKPGINYTVEMPLVLKRVAGTNQYRLSERYSGSPNWGWTGFFPLDSLNGNSAAGKKNWGKQNYASWCSINEITPSATLLNVVTYTDCQRYSKSLANGGALYTFENSSNVKKKIGVDVFWNGGLETNSPFRARITNILPLFGDSLLVDIKDPAARIRPFSYMHNYNFTVEGSAIIKYSGTPGESFLFGGDDDLWVFIDDSLVVDLGGIHAPDSTSFDIYEHGTKLSWAPGSFHTLKFFQAERQSDGSNLVMQASFSPPISKFAALTVQAAQTSGKGTKKEIYAYLNSPILKEDIDLINAGKIENPFVVKTNTGIVRGFTPTQISLVPFDNSTTLEERALGNKYLMSFASEGDRPYPTDSLTVNDSAKVDGAHGSLHNAYGTATTTKLFKEFQPIAGVVENKLGDAAQGVKKTPFTQVAELSDLLQSNPDNKALGGEIIFTGQTFGDTTTNGIYFYKDLNGKQIVYNGQGFSQKNRCAMDENNPTISNCLILPHLEVNGPFQLRASLYDLAGQFVKEYKVTVTADMLKQAQANSAALPSKIINGQEAVQNSTVITNIALYPVDEKGRLLGTGAYLVKYDAVLESSSIPTFGDEAGTRAGTGLQTSNRIYKFVKLGYVRNSGN